MNGYVFFIFFFIYIQTREDNLENLQQTLKHWNF